MKGLLACLIVLCYTYSGIAQKKLVIDVFTFGHFKQFHIYQNTAITYKLKGSTHAETHTVVDMEDSLLYIETGESIRLDEIKKIIIDRSIFLT